MKIISKKKLKYTRLKYTLEIYRYKDKRGLDKLYITKEELLAIESNIAFINTEFASIYLRQDGTRIGNSSRANEVEQTVLSGVSNTEFPHAFAMRKEMRHWKMLQLNPVELRKPSSILAKDFIGSDGSNLPAALARMKADDSYIIKDISKVIINTHSPALLSYLIKNKELDCNILYATLFSKVDPHKKQALRFTKMIPVTTDSDEITEPEQKLDKTEEEFCKDLLAIVPVQMTEAWMLADKEALKEELGTQKNNQKLGLSFPLKQVEKIADPKSKIQEIIRIAFKDLPTNKRRVQISSLYSPLGQQVRLDILEKLPSYIKFKTNLTNTLIKLNYIR
ncbi:DUF4276 family protein [Candidatus Marithrix sp. Canyon 246]|uniref:DUF4276 family protein n=1 Tax=Candidatus Marithrix sp. Canyon 246 TaxID=1827136 RepID=UPI000849FD66|nr:DUF4276 family protein [Candidatus Marithrix sp. Canyon 246]